MSALSLANINFLAILVSFVVVCAAVITLRRFTEWRAKQTLSDELAQRDNFALGISYASQVAVVCISIAFLFEEISLHTAQQRPLRVILLIGLFFTFIFIGQLIHRKWILHRFNEEHAILKQNICAAMVDSGMLLANCIIVLGLYRWVHPQGVSNLLIVTLAFFLLQGIFALDSKLRESRFARFNQGASLQDNFNFANTSIGIRYAGKTIGLALALYAGLGSAPYVDAKLVDNLFALLSHCSAMWLILYSGTFILKHLSLPKVDIGLEVDHQDNIGVACLEFAVFCAIGYLLISMFSL
ncbi:hypothetical protein ACFOEE_05565 [Pseudoalteromonas fenneropenaei]|uniref:DUF350 domain-containing protein n=1 Tax=Pseudoalteromonas fenneropenaei TaxID=1737459 RepID=A0ABV7CHB4_9GAMM